MSTEAETIYIANPAVVFRKEEEEALLFHPDSGAVKLLNQTGTLIFQLLDGKNSLEVIADAIVQEFEDADKEEVRQDVAKFVENMCEGDFVYTVK